MENISKKKEVIIAKSERVVISLGSNIEDRKENLLRGIELWREAAGVNVLAVSSIIETEPVAAPGEIFTHDFLNMCIICDVMLNPVNLLDLCHEIEEKCGRDRASETDRGNRDRTLDCDIIFYGDREIALSFPELIIPHLRWSEREFVIMPMMELIEYLTEWQINEVNKINQNHIPDKTR